MPVAAKSSPGAEDRLNVPRDLAAWPWHDLDFLGWRDPQAPECACLVAELGGELVGATLRCPGPSPLQKRSNICSFCLTSHTGGVTLMVAPRAGQGNPVGTCLCTDLACWLYMRGKKPVAGLGGRFRERLTLEEMIERTMTDLAAFAGKVTAWHEPYLAVQPPSRLNEEPFAKDIGGLHRKTARLATSAGSMRRLTTGSVSMIFLMTSDSAIPCMRAWSATCFSTRGVRT